MVDEILHFAQDDATCEATQAIEIGALVSEVVERQRMLGSNVEWTPPPAFIYRCRPVHLKRALTNLIDSSARHGRVQAHWISPPPAPESASR